MRKVLLALVIVAAVFLLMIVISYMISPFGSGKEIANKKGVPYPAVVAHRGASGLAPESTIAAYELARDMGADYLEADLQRTADGVIIIFHDDSPKRTTNVAEIFPGRENEFIGSFTYEELTQLDAGSWFNKSYPRKASNDFIGLKVITLDQLIDIAEAGNNNPGLYLETKSAPNYPGIEEEIVSILTDRGWLPDKPGLEKPDIEANAEKGRRTVNTAMGLSRIIFQSFHPESLKKFQQYSPDTPRILLVNYRRILDKGWKDTIELAHQLGDGIGPAGYLAFPWAVREAHSKGLLVHPYTVNHKCYISIMWFFGADGFFSDYPGRLLEYFHLK